jgi:predicted nuclease of restriction endonuclease-like RecB superfamily
VVKVHFTSKKINNQSLKVPYFLKPQDHNKFISRIIDAIEDKLGCNEEELNQFDLINSLDSNILITRGVLESLFKWFYNLHGQTIDDISSKRYRLTLWKLMDEKNIRYANKENRTKILENFKDLNQNQIIDDQESFLFGDHKEFLKIMRKGDQKNQPTVSEVIARYNKDVLIHLFSNSRLFYFDLPYDRITPDLVKTIIRNSKLRGIYVEIVEQSPNIYRFEFYGLEELITANQKSGRLMYALFHSIIPSLPSDVAVYLEYQRKSKIIKVYLSNNKNYYDMIIQGEKLTNLSDEISSYDSKVEEEFEKNMIRYIPHWKIQREQVLFEKNRIFIPDFILKYRDKTIIVEIIGFWTEKYLLKKSEKLKLFSEKLKNIVVFVDEKLDFDDKIVPTFKFGKKFPMKSFQSFIEINYELESQQRYISSVMNNIAFYLEKINEKLNNTESQTSSHYGILGQSCLKEIFETTSEIELKLILKEIVLTDEGKKQVPLLSNFLNLNKIFSDECLIITKSLHNKLVDNIIKMVPEDGIKLHNLKHEINSIFLDDIVFSDEEIITILRDCNYREEIDSMFELIFKPPKLKKNR